MPAFFDMHDKEPSGSHVLVEYMEQRRYWTRPKLCNVALTTLASEFKKLTIRIGKLSARVFVVDAQGNKMEMVLPP